jgi:hypothetical protein
VIEDTILKLATAFLGLTTLASAGTFTLNRDACPGSCGLGPFGTVTLTQTSSQVVTVTEQLFSGYSFATSEAAVEFNASGPIAIGGFTPGFEAGPAPASAGSFGSFLYSVSCVDCQAGSLLSFTVSSASGISVLDFVANAGGYAFSSYIEASNGNAGFVAADGSLSLTSLPTTDAVILPEPASMLLFGAGLATLGILRRRVRS